MLEIAHRRLTFPTNRLRFPPTLLEISYTSVRLTNSYRCSSFGTGASNHLGLVTGCLKNRRCYQAVGHFTQSRVFLWQRLLSVDRGRRLAVGPVVNGCVQDGTVQGLLSVIFFFSIPIVSMGGKNVPQDLLVDRGQWQPPPNRVSGGDPPIPTISYLSVSPK